MTQAPQQPTVTRRIRAYGIVQGVGFRPTMARHAAQAQITGTVCNKGPYVEMVAQGTPTQVGRFEWLLRHEPPRRSSILKVDVRDVPCAPPYPTFSIVESERTRGAIFVSPDIAICDECTKELFDPTNRRYLHPFINCTNCGPRLTILDALPYDRERTSMGAFSMCDACDHEYHDPTSRRYDAQPVCCNDCGPQVFLLGRPERGQDAITEARRIVAAGGVIAVKGIGGFHLCCDATSPAAVDLLRARKHRPDKPFAVMARDLAVATRECTVSHVAQDILCGHQKPILLLPRAAGGKVCAQVAPHNPKLGIMLPYAPLQLLLFTYPDGIRMPDCLVMTSANESGAPICRDDEDARRELGPLCDAILSHDRLIRVRADDTVMDLYKDAPYMVRRSRGYAPLPCPVSSCEGTTVLAVGGELKNAFCVGKDDLLYLSPYVGDLGDVRTVEALEETVHRMLTLLEARPQVLACDLHPGYNSTAVARRLAGELGVALVPVQHHFAHVVSCMAENDVAGPVIGISFDGTGYGEDGTIWGGEVMRADASGYLRLGHITPFAQAGGDASAREGWRIALALLLQELGSADKTHEAARALGLCTEQEANVVLAMVGRGINCVTSTSAGRLFDAVSAVLGIRRCSSFEGEAATQLQFAAERVRGDLHVSAEALPLLGDEDLLRQPSPDAPFVLATDTLFSRIVQARLRGAAPEELAYAFHDGLARLVEAACLKARADAGVETVALTGGCYQNLLLLRLTEERLRARGFEVLTHSLVPPNDGGIALGQALVASCRLQAQDGTAEPTKTKMTAVGRP